MRALSAGLVVAAGFALGWSSAQAAPDKQPRRHKKAKRAVAPAPAPDPAEPAESPSAGSRSAESPSAGSRSAESRSAESRSAESRSTGSREDAGGARVRSAAQGDAKLVALETPGDRDERDATDPRDLRDDDRDTAKLVKQAPAPASSGWQVSIGPYLWASSVNANVSLGNAVTTGVDIGFIPLVQHARYGAEILAEVRHGKFALNGDLMYGSEGVTGSTSVASVMVTLTGNASSLLVDAGASYDVLGDEDSMFSLEARAGIRYQRTDISGAVDIGGFSVNSPDAIDDGTDGIVGTRAVFRPAHWFFLSGVFDYGVVGASDTTWSASADASLRVTSHILFSAGWRTLTMDRALVSLTMQGPRAALQLVF